MASGCNTSDTNRGPITTPDRNVKYTGPAIPSLGICVGDYLDEVTAAIVERLIEYATGIGISLPDVDIEQCDFLDGFVQCCIADKSLTGLMNGVLKALCTLDQNITDVTTLITTVQNSVNYTIVPGCLTVANSKIDTVLNKLINEYCALITKLTAIFGDLDNPVFNTTLITQITDTVLNTVLNSIHGCSPADISKTGTGINTQLTIRGIVPKGAFLYGDWPVSYFDTDGMGLEEYGLCGFAMCSGNEYATDARGLTFAVATNLPSALSLTMNNRVDPVLNGDADYATNIGDVKGRVKYKLMGAESGLQSHTHSITQNPHTHKDGIFDRLLSHTGQYTVNDSDSNDSNGREPALNDSRIIPGALADITINPSAAADAVLAHENRQPTLYVNCIQRIF